MPGVYSPEFYEINTCHNNAQRQKSSQHAYGEYAEIMVFGFQNINIRVVIYERKYCKKENQSYADHTARDG